MKRLAMVVIFLGLNFSTSSFLAQAAPLPFFTDVSDADSAFVAVQMLAERGFLQTPEALFFPTEPLSRAAGYTLAGRMAGLAPEGARDCFLDVQNEWFAPYVCSLAAADGPAPLFYPEEPMTTDAFLELIQRATNSLLTAEESAIVTEVTSPFIARGEAATVFYRFLLIQEYGLDGWADIDRWYREQYGLLTPVVLAEPLSITLLPSTEEDIPAEPLAEPEPEPVVAVDTFDASSSFVTQPIADPLEEFFRLFPAERPSDINHARRSPNPITVDPAPAPVIAADQP